MHEATSYDVAVIGGGPAGLSASIWLARYLHRVILIDSGDPRNWETRGINGFLGHPGIRPAQLRGMGREEARSLGVELVDALCERVACYDEEHFHLTLDEAVDLDSLGPIRDRTNPESRIPNPGLETVLIPMERLLPGFPAVTVTAEGLTRVSHGQQVRPVDLTGEAALGAAEWVRLLDPGGALVGVGTPQGLSGFLHPEVVLI